MTSRDIINDTINRKNVSSSGFWVGHPADDAKEIYFNYLGIEEEELSEHEKANLKASALLANKTGRADVEFSKKVKSDMIWFAPDVGLAGWNHPEGKPMWDVFNGEQRQSLNHAGCFAETEDIAEVEAFDWPNPDYLDETAMISDVKYAYDSGLAIFGGMWCPFWHTMADFFGMENYFMKMITDPDVVIAATERVVDFYLKTNEKVLKVMAPYLSAAFFGSDLGSQLDTLVSRDMLKKFVYPYHKKIIRQIKSFGLKVSYHSCGAISSIIPDLIDMGVDILHPLQALAPGMDANSLKQYKNDLIFMGGIDTQDLLPFGTAQQVRDEVHRVKDILGPGYIVSPSHEALLANVPIENVLAMGEASKQ